jgi:hypothetical protein
MFLYVHFLVFLYLILKLLQCIFERKRVAGELKSHLHCNLSDSWYTFEIQQSTFLAMAYLYLLNKSCMLITSVESAMELLLGKVKRQSLYWLSAQTFVDANNNIPRRDNPQSVFMSHTSPICIRIVK